MADLSLIEFNCVYKKCVLLLIVLAVPSIVSSEECDPGKTYLDQGTGRCEPCGHICELRHQQGIEDCRIQCPGYQPRTCRSLQYFDDVVGRCEPCRSVCIHRSSSSGCRKHCPDWHKKPRRKTYSTTSSRNITEPSTTRVAGNTRVYAEENKFPYLIIGIVAALVLLVAVVLGTVCNKRSRKRPKHPQQVVDRTEDMSHPMTQPFLQNGRGPFMQATRDEEDMV